MNHISEDKKDLMIQHLTWAMKSQNENEDITAVYCEAPAKSASSRNVFIEPQISVVFSP